MGRRAVSDRVGAVLACAGDTALDTLNRVFFAGSLFFTSAAGLQWLEASLGDVGDLVNPVDRPAWRWLRWRPRNLGYLAGLVQFAGTLLFNLNTVDAIVADPTREAQLLLVWTPNMLGCACFLIASYLALVEVSHRFLRVDTPHLSWWIAVINMAGSVAFQISAIYAFGTGSASAWNSALWTALGAGCFLVGAYLLLPEMFDDEGATEPRQDPPGSLLGTR